MRKIHAARIIGSVSLVFCGITACSSSQTIPFDVITQSNQCYQQEAKITPLLTAKEQTNFLSRFSAFKLPEDKEALSSAFKQHAQTQHIFIVSLGSKPTSGYGFKILSNAGRLEHHTLSLPIALTSPDADSFSAQVMTSPCMVIGIDSSSSYQELVIDKLKLNILDN